MFEFDEKGNLLVDNGIHFDRRYSNLNFVRIGGVWHKCISRWYRSGEELSKSLHPVERYTPDKEGYTERNPIVLEMSYHVVIEEDGKNA